MRAFKDSADGYYQYEGTDVPEWAKDLTPCDVIVSEEVVFVPQTLTNYQGKVTLDAFQIYDTVETYMLSDQASRAAKFAWTTGAFERQGQFILECMVKFGLTDEQVDQMFIYGAKVQ